VRLRLVRRVLRASRGASPATVALHRVAARLALFELPLLHLELLGQEREAAEVKYGQEDDPDDPEGIDALADGAAAAPFWPLGPVACVDLWERDHDDEDTNGGMEVVLGRAARAVGVLDEVDERPEGALYDVQDAENEAKTLRCGQ